jgi:hypothetical protein
MYRRQLMALCGEESFAKAKLSLWRFAVKLALLRKA